MIGKEKQKKTRDLETDYLLEDKTKLNRSKTYKDGPSKGSCDVPRQNSPGSRTEKPAWRNAFIFLLQNAPHQMSLKPTRAYLRDPVTPHKKADPLVMSKRLKIAAVSLYKMDMETFFGGVLMRSGSRGSAGGSVVMSEQGLEDVEEMDFVTSNWWFWKDKIEVKSSCSNNTYTYIFQVWMWDKTQFLLLFFLWKQAGRLIRGVEL